MKRYFFVLIALLSLIGCSTKYENEIEFISEPSEASIYFYSKNLSLAEPELLGETPFKTNKIPNRARYFQFRKPGHFDSELIPFSGESLKREDVTMQVELRKKSYLTDNTASANFELTENGLQPVLSDYSTDTKPERKLGAGAIIGIIILLIIVIILVIVFWDFVVTLFTVALNGFYLVLAFIFYLTFVTIPNQDKNKVILELNTSPASADIYIGNHPDSLELFEYGVTPIKIKAERGELPRLVQFTKEGYDNSDIFHLPVSMKARKAYTLSVALQNGDKEFDPEDADQTAKNTLDVSPFVYADNISIQLNPEKSIYATPDYRGGRNVAIVFIIVVSIIVFIIALIYLANDKPWALLIGLLIYAGLIIFRVRLQKKIYAHTYYSEKILIESQPPGALLYHGNLSNSMSVFIVPESAEIKAKNLVQSEFFEFKKPGYKDSGVIKFPKEKSEGFFVIQASLEPE